MIRSYLTEGDTDTYVIDAPPNQGVTVTTFDVENGNIVQNDRRVGWVRDSNNTQNGRSDISVDSYIVALQDYFLDGRIVTTFGYR